MLNSILLGSFLAALFGMLSLFLDWIKSNNKRKIAAKIIAGELESILRSVELLKKTISLKLPDGSETYGGLVYSRFVESNSFPQYRPYIMEIISKEEVIIIEDVYRRFSRLDKDMQLAVQVHLNTGCLDEKYKDDGIKKSVQFLVRTFWGFLSQKEIDVLINEGKKVVDRLLQNSKNFII